MKSWKSVLAFGFAGVFVTTLAFAQGTTPSQDQRTPDKSEQPKSGDTTSGSSDRADKSGAMKSDTMKSGRGSAGAGNREQVRAVQQALKDKGHDPGSIDGVMGPRTQAALKDFQKTQGIQETGRLDAETMAKLGIEARTGAADQSTPAASPQTGAGSSSPSDASKGSSSDTSKSSSSGASGSSSSEPSKNK